MTEEQIALARRAVACKGWRWMAGMRALPCSLDGFGMRGIPVRVVYVYDIDGIVVWGDVSGADGGSWEEWRWREEGRLPDFTDAATLGCLLALVREAWGDPAYLWGGHAEVRRDSETLFVVLRFGHDANGFLVERWVASGATEAEALVAALEAAP